MVIYGAGASWSGGGGGNELVSLGAGVDLLAFWDDSEWGRGAVGIGDDSFGSLVFFPEWETQCSAFGAAGSGKSLEDWGD